jgi:hypothetical protein
VLPPLRRLPPRCPALAARRQADYRAIRCRRLPRACLGTELSPSRRVGLLPCRRVAASAKLLASLRSDSRVRTSSSAPRPSHATAVRWPPLPRLQRVCACARRDASAAAAPSADTPRRPRFALARTAIRSSALPLVRPCHRPLCPLR